MSSKLAKDQVSYLLDELVQETGFHVLYKGRNLHDTSPLLLKIRRSGALPQPQLRSMKLELELTQSLDIDGLLVPIRIDTFQTSPVLVFADTGAIPLWSYLQRRTLSVGEVLRLMIPIIRSLSELHERQLLHGSINPYHLFIHPIEGKMFFAGLESCSQIGIPHTLETGLPVSPEHLPYISPEQTGRLAQAVNEGSDLYSMGVVIYEMLTGALPFEAKELSEWVYAHVAKEPISPFQHNPELPLVISNILLKLLSKNLEDRYQSADSLEKDLQACLHQWAQYNHIEDFQLGAFDRMDRLKFPQKLYGRERETTELLTALDHICTGKKELVFISGYSGVGKTSLAQEMRKAAQAAGCLFIASKCSQSRLGVPYEPLLQVYNQFIHQILMENKEKVIEWKAKIVDALGINSPIITAVLPDLEIIIGKQPEAPMLPGIELQNRFILTFIKFARLFCREDCPLVFLLDDLQWTDAGTLRILQTIMSDPQIHHLMVIGTYRSNELTSEHPLHQAFMDLQSEVDPIRSISLETLDAETLNEWVKDTLQCSDAISRPLVKELYNKSHGNPFFAKQFLDSIYANNLLDFAGSLGQWSYNLEQIKAQKSSENVVDLVIFKILKLSPKLQNLLMLASCLGEKFDLSALKEISDDSQTEQLLWVAVHENILIIHEEEKLQFHFFHDRVFDAIQAQLTAEKRSEIHQQIALWMQQMFGVDIPEEKVFELIRHLNLGANKQMTFAQRCEIAELNGRAGRKAKASSAFEAALGFFESALQQLSDHEWAMQKPLLFSLVLDSAECYYVTGNSDRAEEWYDKLLSESLNDMDRALVYRQKLMFYVHLRLYNEAIAVGLQGLKLFGLKLPVKPGKAHLFCELIWIMAKTKNSKYKDLNNLPPMHDEEKRRMMDILKNMGAPAYHVDQNLLGLVTLKMFHLTLMNGHSEISSSVFCSYGLFLSVGFGFYDLGYEMGSFGIWLSNQYKSLSIKGESYFIYASFIHHWKRPIRETIEYLRQGLSYCLEAGNTQLAGPTCSFLAISQMVQGVRLDEVYNDLQENLETSSRFHYELSVEFLPFLKRVILILKGEVALHSEEAERFMLTDYIGGKQEDEAALMLVYNTQRMQLLILFGEYRRALELGLHTLSKQKGKAQVIAAHEFYFYLALALAKQIPSAHVSDRRRYQKILKQIAHKIRLWTKLCPENFLHKWEAISAEMAKLRGDDAIAFAAYERAIQAARLQQYTHHSAMINELAGIFYLEKGLTKLAKSYLQEAYYDYLEWGAVAKAAELYKQYATLLDYAPGMIQQAAAGGGNVNHLLSQAIDYSTLAGAFQTISGEIVFDKLLEKLIRLLMENAGAEKGFLLLEKGGRLYVEAEGVSGGNAFALHSTPLEVMTNLSSAIVYYTARTGKPVVLHDATRDSMFRTDAYVQLNQVKSLLCMPILKQGKQIGILYLENNRAAGIFTPIRLIILSILSAQAAVSIENARLYNEMELKVLERTLELEKTNRELQSKNEELTRMEISRRHLLTNISHDLRTPMTLIQGYVEGILEGVIDDPEQKTKYLNMIYTKVISLNYLIKDLFQLTTLEARRFPFDIQVISLPELVQYIKERYEPDIQSAGLRFHVTLPPFDEERGYTIAADLDRINQVFFNLIFNSIRHTPEGGEIRVHFSLLRGPQEDSEGADEPSQLLVTLEDNGTGIAEEDFSYIFDRFYKGNKSRNSQSEEGSGLGLAICKEIVESHGGHIWVDTERKEGSAFCFTLPLAQESSVPHV